MAKKKNWDLIRNQEDKDTVKYRDVYEDQQLERGSIAEKETMTSRIVLAALASLLVGVLVWTIVSSVQMFTRKEGLDSNANPQDDYIHLGEFYYNPTDASDIISKEEYDIWYQQYHDYDGQRSSKDEPPDVPVDDTNEFAAKFSYDSETNTYSLKSSLYGQGETYSVAEYQQAVSDHYAEYQKKYDDYVLYYHRHTDPEYRKGDANSGIYAKAKSDLYREIGTTAVISKDAYDAKVQAYKKDMEDGKISEDVASIPLKPIDYSLIYSPYKFDYMSYAELWRLDSTDKLDVPDISGESEFMSFIKTCASKKINLLSNPYPDTMIAPDPDDTNAVKKYEAFQSFYKQLKELFPSYNFDTYGEYWDLFETYCTAAHFDREKKTYIHGTDMVKVILSYKSNYDGSVIERKEYKELINKYDQDYAEYKAAYLAHRKKYHPDNIDGSTAVFTMAPNLIKILISLIISGVVFGILYFVLKKNLTAQNIMSSTEDINQYHNDQHVALPEEVQKNYDWFPDVGAHSSVQVSSMISHMAISNKGLKQVTMAKRAKDDIKDKNGDIEYYKGEIILNDEGDPKTYQAPIVDTDFMEALFDASGASKDKDKRRYYDTTKIPYNPGNGNRDKLSGYDTVADLINNDWEFPLYEPQRPAGAYIVDTAPVNTMVLAITRAGKGQTVIEPTLDMWMREKRPNNMVVNDPKGELLVKNYVRATVRGLQVVQFNLINAMKTDIYNPLALAADAAREGDNTKCAMYVENIAEVFFPVDGADDPVWPNAANNAFKRAAYGLIDFYLEEEKAMRRMAERTHIDEKVLEQRIDEMWGKVTLYNCYQLFVQLSSKKMKNPAVEFTKKAEKGGFSDLSDDEYEVELQKIKNKSRLWEDKPEADLLTLYFSATDILPRNSMRTLVANANNALKAMGGAEKMMASCDSFSHLKDVA